MNHSTIHTHRQPPQRNPSKNTIPALPGCLARFTLHASRFTRQQALAPTTSVENVRQLSPFYAKQTQFAGRSNKPNSC